jgi:hypothetical protein
VRAEGIDTEAMPLGRLTKEDIEKAKEIISDIRKLVHKIHPPPVLCPPPPRLQTMLTMFSFSGTTITTDACGREGGRGGRGRGG